MTKEDKGEMRTDEDTGWMRTDKEKGQMSKNRVVEYEKKEKNKE